MAVPTLLQLRTVIVEHIQQALDAGEVPRLDVIQARVAALFTDPNAIVRMRIENQAGIYTLVAELERDGTIITRSWTPTHEFRQDIIADVFCQDYGATRRTAEEQGLTNAG